MISAILCFFGITLIYTGFLVSGRDLTTGIAVAGAGFILLIKPALAAAKHYGTLFGGGSRPHGPKTAQKARTRKVYIKIVKSEDDKPTIH